jgi:hypothetical protein
MRQNAGAHAGTAGFFHVGVADCLHFDAVLLHDGAEGGVAEDRPGNNFRTSLSPESLPIVL